MVGLIGHFHLHKYVTGEKSPFAFDFAPAPYLDDFFGRYHDCFEELAQTLGGCLLLDRVGDPLLEIRIGVNDVPALGHAVLLVSGHNPKRTFSMPHLRTASTMRKKTQASATMIITMAVV